ncbi:MAG: hydrolase, partial [Verrucomicrobiae bacterium]|nr:hydrolase [Verrucomicrobiae bacterium]
ARSEKDGRQIVVRTKNVARLMLPRFPKGQTITLDGARFVWPPQASAAEAWQFVKQDGAWKLATGKKNAAFPPHKRRGLQGPIDDAFMESFLCVRPTGVPNHALVNDAARTRLDLFAKEFSKWMRGDVRLKNDAVVTKDDIASHNLILFGDPASNRLIAQIAGNLPIRWTKASITVGGKSFSAADHILVMIYPDPLNPDRYVVLNSGHTFGEKEFRCTNALLFPRLGDYAVIKLTKAPDGKVSEEVVLAGLFNEQWQLAEPTR